MIESTAIRSFRDLEDLRSEWANLHRDAAPGTPFEHPGWALNWARRFVDEDDLHCIALRDDGRGNALVGFAPMYRQRRSVGPLAMTTLRPLGTGRQQALTEVVQVLALADHTQDVLRAVIGHLEGLDDWNWAQLSIGPQQGWLLPQWLENYGEQILVHRNTRPCVMFSGIPADPAELKSGLKRNLKESIRRCRNRSAKFGSMTFRCATDADDVEKSVESLISLHGMRSRMAGKVEHRDIFGGSESDFLRQAAKSLAAEGLAQVQLAEHDGNPVAALLVLSDGQTDYISATGLDPEYWDLSLNTMLIFHALENCASAGKTAMNLSTGPDIAKMRWSTDVVGFHDFDIVRQDRKSRWLYNSYSHATSARETRNEARKHRKADPQGNRR